jgi:hypothetical protein
MKNILIAATLTGVVTAFLIVYLSNQVDHSNEVTY